MRGNNFLKLKWMSTSLGYINSFSSLCVFEYMWKAMGMWNFIFSNVTFYVFKNLVEWDDFDKSDSQINLSNTNIKS